MYSSSETSARIKKIAKEKGVQMLDLQEQCGLSKNAIAQAGRSQDGMKARNLYAIAELLEVSIDYLLGRTDNPNATVGTSYISGNNNGVQAISNGNHSSLTVNGTTGTDKDTDELVSLVQSLPLVKKAEAIIYLNKLKKES